MGADPVVSKWLHIEATVGDPWILPIWAAVNRAVARKRIQPLSRDERELGLHVSTRLDILPHVISRVNSEVGEIYELSKAHEPDNVFTAQRKGYVLRMPRELVFSLLADIDSLLFELNSVCELMKSLFERLHSHIGAPIGSGKVGAKIKQILEATGSDSRWFRELDVHRNFFIHEGAPFFGIDISSGEGRYDLLIMRENLESFDHPEKFIRLSQIASIVRRFAMAKPVLQNYLIQMFSSFDP